MKFTVVFEGSPKSVTGNPFDIESAFGTVSTIATGDVCEDSDAFRDALEEIADRSTDAKIVAIAEAALDARDAVLMSILKIYSAQA